MTSEKDLEKGVGEETGANTESTSYQSDAEKAEEQPKAEGATGYPDTEHDNVEEMDQGHLSDLARQHVSPSSGWLTTARSDWLVDHSIDQSRPSNVRRNPSNNDHSEQSQHQEPPVSNSNKSHIKE